MILLTQRQFERFRAQYSRMASVHLECREPRCNVKPVVAVSRETETHCLNRYPSPKGRTGCPQGRPPQFFSRESKAWLARRSYADHCVSHKNDFHSGQKHAIPLWIRTITERGTSLCGNHSSPLRLLQPVSQRQAVAIRRSNRGSWGQGPARQGLSCSMATWQPARLSALRPTSPIARNTRHAAERALNNAAGNSPAHHSRKAIAGPARGGFFFACRPEAARAPGRNSEGT